jgi:transcriptional regulator GlxA family with amidase domain
VPCGLSHGVRPLPEALLGPSQRFVEATQRSAEVSEAFAALLETLASERLCALPVMPLDAGTRSLQRVLDALSSLYGGQRTGAHGDLVAELARVSLRQLSRDMRDFTQSAPIPGATMRELFRVMRLRRAALLLSAAELSVEDVAREVGYGSSDAMGRAFRDARLPSPSEMRRSLVESE